MSTFTKWTIILPLFIFSVFTLSLSGCSENSVTTNDNVSVSYVGSAATYTDGAALVLDTVKVLIKDVKLNVANSSDTTNFKTGMFVLYIHFDSTVTTLSTAQVPSGNYDKLKFEIHKVEDNETPPDPEFVDVNGRYSVIVKGKYNDTSFVFKSDKSAHQKYSFPKVAPVATNASTNITIRMEPYKWFMEAGLYLDPRIPANVSIIENNIKENINDNIKAFLDNNKDGEPD